MTRQEFVEAVRRLAKELSEGLEVENYSAEHLLEAAAALLEDHEGSEEVFGTEDPSWEFFNRLLEAALYYE